MRPYQLGVLLMASMMAGCLVWDGLETSDSENLRPQPEPVDTAAFGSHQNLTQPVERFDLHQCTGVESYVELPSPVFPHEPPEGWPGATGYMPRLVAIALQCEEAVIDSDLYLPSFELCLFVHTNITETDGAWQEARYTVLWDSLGVVVNYADVLVSRLPLLSPTSGTVEMDVSESMGRLEMFAKCKWGDGEVNMEGKFSTTGPSNGPGVPHVARLLTDASDPAWWSINILEKRFRQLPENPALALAVTGLGTLSYSGSTPFEPWPVQDEGHLYGARIGAFTEGEYRWYRNGTGLE